jgi:pilus assembly protein Flp/PilA
MMWINALKVVLYDQRGQGLVEYNLILILVSLLAIAALVLIGKFLPGILTTVLGSLQ